MLIPIRCFSCGTVIADRWVKYQGLIESGKEIEEALDEVKLTRYCCRRMYVSHVELIAEVAPFSTYRY
jgi:DNA-directed RNA polymerase subunit N (RpoN/RPB10)